MTSFHAFVTVSAANNLLSKIISAVKIHGYLLNSSRYAVKMYLHMSQARRQGIGKNHPGKNHPEKFITRKNHSVGGEKDPRHV